MAWEYFLKLEKTELTNTWTAISGIKFSFRKPCEKYHPCIKPHNPKKICLPSQAFQGSKGSKVLKWRNPIKADVLKPFNPYWHCEQVWCPPITRNNAVAKSNAWLSPPGNLAGQAWNYQLQMIDKTLIRGAGGGMLDDGSSSNCKGNWYTKRAKVFLTSAFGIRFAWLPSPNSILWLQ